MSTHHNPTRRTDRRTAREELETEAPLCPDLGTTGTTDTTDTTDLRRELRRIRDRLDRIERRLEAER
jgi:hypothetical protein